jgi:hypothetical protein
MYAGAVFTRKPVGDDWKNLYSLRKLSQGQLKEAFDLGKKVVETLSSGRAKPYSIVIPGGKVTDIIGRLLTKYFGVIEAIEE